MILAEEILRYSYGPASMPEIAWTALGILGMVYIIGLMRECLADYAALKISPYFVHGGARDIIARRNIRDMIQRILKFCAILAIGGAGLASTPSNTKAGPSPYAVVLSVGLMVIEVIMVAGAFLDRQDRKEMFFQDRLRRSDDLPPEIIPAREETAP